MDSKTWIVGVITFGLCGIPAFAQTSQPATQLSQADQAKAKSDAEIQKRAQDWVAPLNLNDSAKEDRVQQVIATHLTAVRDWHNSHNGSEVPQGINPATGKKLSAMDRQLIIDSTLPKSAHEALMIGLKQDLTPDQIDAILDKYTEGKVAFTLKGYHAIVPDLKPEEEATILGFLKQAREQAVDFKSTKLISAIFEIYKTKSEQYLNSQGRNWHALYKAYTDEVKARKAAATLPTTQTS